MSFIRKHKTVLTAAAAIAALYLVFFLLDITCPIKYLTGVSCAGCGMTRAWMCVLHLDIAGAVEYHPLFWTIPIIAAAFLLKKRLPTLFRVTAYVTVGLFIVVYILRMIDPDCQIVVFEPRSSLFYRIVDRLF